MLNINDKNYEKVRDIANSNSMTITNVINMAIEHYLFTNVMMESMKDLFTQKLSGISLDTIKKTVEKKNSD